MNSGKWRRPCRMRRPRCSRRAIAGRLWWKRIKQSLVVRGRMDGSVGAVRRPYCLRRRTPGSLASLGMTTFLGMTSFFGMREFLELTTRKRKKEIMNKKTSWMVAASMLALCALLLTMACNKQSNTEQSSNNMSQTTATAPVATPIDPATVATVNGTVKFDGTAPKAAKIDMSQDPACKGMNEAEAVVVTGGDLANVFVYVKDGLGSRTFDVPKDEVVLDQSGCKYHPHVLGVMAGATGPAQE